jgi:hypothetical protein
VTSQQAALEEHSMRRLLVKVAAGGDLAIQWMSKPPP